MHTSRRALLAACLLSPFLLTGTARAEAVPVPESKLAYVGHWHGKDMQLKLARDGKIYYKRDQPGKKVSLDIELLGFNGNNFDAGWGLIRSTFMVSQPPRRVGKQWKMTVDGVELTREE